ncbi:YXWGXW repeat-containing protein [Comamonas sp. GB3 AK4-5]|uniref:YXWGXW repeat-containing protein n=1 Tax=Comamonas sp. GB3 AK4-5 TaxID=3231487 RepID=UPI00351ED62F
MVARAEREGVGRDSRCPDHPMRAACAPRNDCRPGFTQLCIRRTPGSPGARMLRPSTTASREPRHASSPHPLDLPPAAGQQPGTGRRSCISPTGPPEQCAGAGTGPACARAFPPGTTAPRHEARPKARHGQTWVAGHWRWQGPRAAYVWEPGHWVRASRH